jgi:hypothetical protein
MSNTKKDKQLEAFVNFRLQGLSYDECSEKLDVHRSTLIDWAKELNLNEKMKKVQFLKIEALVKLNQLTNEYRLKKQIEFLKKCYDEIEKRDLTELPTDKLYNLITNITEQIKIGMPKIEYEVHGTGKILDWDTSIIKLTPLE